MHLSETCDHDAEPATSNDDQPRPWPGPNLIVNMAPTASTVPDVKATTGIHQHLHDHRLLPAEHYLDSGYPSADTIAVAATFGVTMVTPAPLDQSVQARAGTGYDKTRFTIDFDTRQVTCPQGQGNSW